jgi:site-specific recombinase
MDIRATKGIIDQNVQRESIVKLKSIILNFRSKGNRDTGEKELKSFIHQLQRDPLFKQEIQSLLTDVFSQFDPSSLFTYSGILGSHGFVREFLSRFKHKILPPIYPKGDVRNLVHEIFENRNDFNWVNKLPESLIAQLLEELEIKNIFEISNSSKSVIERSIQVLSHDLVSMSLDPSIQKRLAYKDLETSPFIQQNKVILQAYSEESSLSIEYIEEVNFYLNQCIRKIQQLRERKNEFGTSLHITFLTKRILQIIARIKLLFGISSSVETAAYHKNLAKIFKELLDSEYHSLSLRHLTNENLDLLAFEIVDHAAKKGERYIANNTAEYWSYLVASMKGGLLISIFAIFKIYIEKLSLSPVGEGLLFSINYAICFILVYTFGGIIATKQPAMTASAVAQSMDTNDDGHIDNLHGLKNLIVRVSRSQFISLFGNLICAFPVSYLLLKGFSFFGGLEFVSTDKANTLISDIHPLLSGSLFFACIAGVFLSFSGLFSGYVSNKLIYSNIPERIRYHGRLRRYLGKSNLNKLSVYFKENLAMLAGNISLGFCLGMAGTFGYIMGLPLDIRHVAFSTANAGMAFSTPDLLITSNIIWMTVLGIALIGFLNFIVSFGFTLTLALKSRQISFGQTKELLILLIKHFLRYPMDYFFYPRMLKELKLLKWSLK